LHSESGCRSTGYACADHRGAKLSDTELAATADRLTDFVMYCSPDESARSAPKFSYGPITVGASFKATVDMAEARTANHCRDHDMGG